MAVRFRRSIKIAGGLRLNINKNSLGLSVGPRGARVSVNTRGRVTTSAGIPGTGLAYVKTGNTGGTSTDMPNKPTTTSTIGQSTILRNINSLTPREGGLGYWSRWSVIGVLSFFVCALIAKAVSLAALIFPAVCFLFAGISITSPKRAVKRRAAKFIINSIKTKAKNGESIKNAANTAPLSWTVQAYAGAYFFKNDEMEEASRYFYTAAKLFEGDERFLMIMSSECAVEIGRYDRAVSLLEPYVDAATPENDGMDVILLARLGNALNKRGDYGKALGITGQLPLRRRNLDDALLLGLSARAEAKIGLRQFADAQRDIDRIYAIDPYFDTIEDLEELLEARK